VNTRVDDDNAVSTRYEGDLTISSSVQLTHMLYHSFFSQLVDDYRYVHFTTYTNLPFSMTESVYDIATRINNFTTQVALIDGVFLREDMRRLSPMTALFATNEGWSNKVIALEEISKTVLENMIFEDLLWCDTLRDLIEDPSKDPTVESLNGQSWFLSLNNESMPCFDTILNVDGPTFKACVTRCDILAKNGIVHEMDNILLFKSTETIGPQAPTIAVPRQPSAPTWNAPTIPAEPANAFQSPSFSSSFGAGTENSTQAAGSSAIRWCGACMSPLSLMMVVAVLMI
jgi:Fasciclin domain